MKGFKKWWAWLFEVITNEQAKEWNLTHVRNVHGDEINHLNCRSIWKDKRNRHYRVRNLHNTIPPPAKPGENPFLVAS